jgi:hypothetical protein
MTAKSKLNRKTSAPAHVPASNRGEMKHSCGTAEVSGKIVANEKYYR